MNDGILAYLPNFNGFFKPTYQVGVKKTAFGASRKRSQSTGNYCFFKA
jgi:hypothetical protein